mmetsp:Transcript_43462/g.105494  ORF Transcript_43462/g.105494 Transcript_43462/m.105494 type:complete len:243 (+) Transcript_43462:296-1024(+)
MNRFDGCTWVAQRLQWEKKRMRHRPHNWSRAHPRTSTSARLRRDNQERRCWFAHQNPQHRDYLASIQNRRAPNRTWDCRPSPKERLVRWAHSKSDLFSQCRHTLRSTCSLISHTATVNTDMRIPRSGQNRGLPSAQSSARCLRPGAYDVVHKARKAAAFCSAQRHQRCFVHQAMLDDHRVHRLQANPTSESRQVRRRARTLGCTMHRRRATQHQAGLRGSFAESSQQRHACRGKLHDGVRRG